MKIHEFSKNDQEQINKGLSTAKISDKEAADKIIELVPKEWIKKIPFFVRGHATSKAVEKIANEHPDLYEVAKRQGDLPEKEREELKGLITNLFKERMKKHNIK